MAKIPASSNRLPRGTKPVAQAFLQALDKIPQASRSAVARAAQTLIRDELRANRDKQKAMRAEFEKRDTDAEGGRSTKRGTHESARRQVGPSRAG